MLVKQIYELLEQAELVETLEEYSTQWLNKHKTTASYLIHKNRDLSINVKLNCLSNIKNKIQNTNTSSTFNTINPHYLINLQKAEGLVKADIKRKFNINL